MASKLSFASAPAIRPAIAPSMQATERPSHLSMFLHLALAPSPGRAGPLACSRPPFEGCCNPAGSGRE